MPADNTNLSLNPNTVTLLAIGIAVMILMGNNKGCDLGGLVKPPQPAVTAKVTPSPATVAACAPIKTAAATADAAKRARISAAFSELAYVISISPEKMEIKSTGKLNDILQDFGDIVAIAEPDLRAVVPINTALETARDSVFALTPGKSVDKPITKAQAADFVAAIAVSLE